MLGAIGPARCQSCPPTLEISSKAGVELVVQRAVSRTFSDVAEVVNPDLELGSRSSMIELATAELGGTQLDPSLSPELDHPAEERIPELPPDIWRYWICDPDFADSPTILLALREIFGEMVVAQLAPQPPLEVLANAQNVVLGESCNHVPNGLDLWESVFLSNWSALESSAAFTDRIEAIRMRFPHEGPLMWKEVLIAEMQRLLQASGLVPTDLPESLEEQAALLDTGLMVMAPALQRALEIDLGQQGVLAVKAYAWRNWMSRHGPWLAGLQRLDLASLGLSLLPPEFRFLGNLRHLVLDHNRLHRLGAWIGELNQLERLDVSNNQLEAISSEIGRLGRLRQLYLNQNRLTSLPVEMMGLRELIEVNLEDNQVTTLSDEFKHWAQGIGHFDLRRNPISINPALPALAASVQASVPWGFIERAHQGSSHSTVAQLDAAAIAPNPTRQVVPVQIRDESPSDDTWHQNVPATNSVEDVDMTDRTDELFYDPC